MVDKKIDEKEAWELGKIYNHYFDKKKKNTSFRVENVFGDVISKNSFIHEQKTKPKNLSAKIM